MTGRPQDPSLSGLPKEIRRLDESVVNRIAAGEVIQRPANALKEILENSLDAGATSVNVVVARGGLQLLQVTDNGCGIRKSDLEIVCRRFTTSKLKSFSDLSSIETFGFRGEALASISHVAKLTILTRTGDSQCGFKLEYSDGKPVDPKPISCAANRGTQITVQDLFFNVPIRQRVLKSPYEEFSRISDVISKYAVHNAGVAFSLKKTSSDASAGSGEFRTQMTSNVRDNVATLYGTSIARELVPFNVDEMSSILKFKAHGWATNANYNAKKCVFLLFINHRLVDSPSLRRAIDLVYSAYLPKGTHPFIYLSVQIDPSHVDVNVHPTKHEVHFLNQDEIVEKIQRAIDAKMMASNSSRTFKTQALLVGAPVPKPLPMTDEKQRVGEEVVASKNLVRTDAREQKLDKFLTSFSSPLTGKNTDGMRGELDAEIESACNSGKSEKSPADQRESPNELQHRKRREVRLTSLKRLRQLSVEKSHPGLKEIIANHSFVGVIDRRFALLQHSTKLFVTNTVALTEHLFYQVVLEDFANFEAFRLNPPAPIEELALLALDEKEAGWTETDGEKSQLANFMVRLLKSKSQILDDYFSLEINDDGNLCTIPCLLPDYVPFFGKLPLFLMRLATEVNWDKEEECLDGVSREIAKFYSVSGDVDSFYDLDQHESDQDEKDAEANEKRWKKVIEHVIYPTMKRKLNPPRICAENLTFTQVANLPDLYKVFERC